MKKSFFSNISFFDLALFLYFAVETNYDWNHSQLLHWGVVAVILIAYIFKLGGRLDLRFQDFSLWMLGIVIMSALTLVYTVSTDLTITMIKNLVVVFVVFFMIRNYMTDYGKVERVLNTYLIGLFVSMCYVLFNIDLETLGEVQLGTQTMEGWNGNGIGLSAVSGGLLAFYFMTKHPGMWKKLLYFVLFGFFTYIAVYTGSRTAIAFLMLSIVACVYLLKPQKIIRNTIFVIVILWGAFYICMNVEPVYNVLGVRLEGLFASVTGEGKVDSSTLLRQEYRENGLRWIEESPIIGYGTDAYRSMNGAETGRRTYSHNNFIEIAINWGVIGFIYYYGYYFWCLKELWKRHKNNILDISIMSIFAVYTCAHYGTVTYYEIWQNLLLCVAAAVIKCGHKDNVLEELENDKKIPKDIQ